MSFLSLLIFPLLVLVAAFTDLLSMRISNRLVLALAGSFFIVALSVGLPWNELGLHVAAALLVLCVTFLFFGMGWMGGGDAKLAAATALWLGFGGLPPYLVYTALLGGILTLLIVAVRRFPLPSPLAGVVWIDRLHDRKSGVPYGIALAAAGLIAYPGTTIFQQLTQ